MRLWSQLRPAVFWIEPGTYGETDRFGRRAKIEGLKVEFTTLGGPGAGSVFDTDAQGWDDDLRDQIESYLRSQPEWGFNLFIADDSVQAGRAVGASCEVMTVVHGGVRKCGRPVPAPGDLCDIHQSMSEAEPAPELAAELPPAPEVLEEQEAVV